MTDIVDGSAIGRSQKIKRADLDILGDVNSDELLEDQYLRSDQLRRDAIL